MEAGQDMRVYVWTDLEGVVGMIDWDTFADESPRFQERRRRVMHLFTNEVLAAVHGALDAGAEDVLVKDSHGPGDSLFFEDLPPEAEFIIGVKGLPHPWAGLDRGFDATMIVGAHPMADTAAGVLPHTHYRINGVDLGDAGLFAAVSASLGVPCVFASGDDAAMAQLREWVPGIATVSTKYAYSPYAARMRSPAKARELIRQTAAEALRRRDAMPPLAMRPPYRVAYAGRTAQGDDLITTFMQAYDPEGVHFGNQNLEPERSYHDHVMKRWYGRFDAVQREEPAP